VAIIGGGATGLGVALDAALRGFSVVLLESHDFAKGTSSRATKLVHGGVRYLAQGNIGLVREALHERTTLLRNAPHLAQPLPFRHAVLQVLGNPRSMRAGLARRRLAGQAGFGVDRVPQPRGHAAPFAHRAAAGPGGAASSTGTASLTTPVWRWRLGRHGSGRTARCWSTTREVTAPLHEAGKLVGLRRGRHRAQAEMTASRPAALINATLGVRWDRRAIWTWRMQRSAAPMVAPSRRRRIVVTRRFCRPTTLMAPKMADGRAPSGRPWARQHHPGHHRRRAVTVREPLPFKSEVDFILGRGGPLPDPRARPAMLKHLGVGCGRWSSHPKYWPAPSRSAASTRCWSAPAAGDRDRGRTTYRAMAEDVLEQTSRLPCAMRQPVSEHHPLVGD